MQSGQDALDVQEKVKDDKKKISIIKDEIVKKKMLRMKDFLSHMCKMIMKSILIHI